MPDRNATQDRVDMTVKATTRDGQWYQWGFRDSMQGLPPSRNVGVRPEYQRAYEKGYIDGAQWRNG